MTYDILPFNACDYRCDKCDKTNDCQVFKMEQAQKLRHILCGEDPSDPEVVIADIIQSIQEAEEVLVREAQERGIDPSTLNAELEEHDQKSNEVAKKHPLYLQAIELVMEADTFLKKCEKLVVITPEIRPLFDDIKWYVMLIPAKTVRALMGFGDSGYMNEDAKATAGVIQSCLSKCHTALTQIAFYRPESTSLSDRLLILIDSLKQGWCENLTEKELE